MFILNLFDLQSKQIERLKLAKIIQFKFYKFEYIEYEGIKENIYGNCMENFFLLWFRYKIS